MSTDNDNPPATTPGTRAELLWRADENCREMFRLLARCASGAIREQGDTTMVATGVKIALFNPVFAPGDSDLTALAERARRFYDDGDLPWALVSSEHAPVASRAEMAGCGLFEAQTLPLMARAAEPDADWPVGAAVEVRAAEDEAALADHRALLTSCFGIPADMSLRALPRLPSPTLRLYVAYDGEGRPVGTGALCEAAGVAGVYNVGTVPAWRRRGVAVAVLRRVLADAAGRGLRTCVLQSTGAGMPLYTRLRFTRLSTYLIYTM